MRSFRDRDFLLTKDNFLFCVIGHIHPKDRVIAYRKYVPSIKGVLEKDIKYRRTMPSYSLKEYDENLKELKIYYPKYLFRSRIFDTILQAVPHGLILKHYKPEERLKQILKSKYVDSLELKVKELTNYLSKESNIPINLFGVTGSVLLKIHNPEFSDIDLTVYGKEQARKMKDLVIKGLDRIEDIPLNTLKNLCKKKAKSRNLDYLMVKYLYSKRWNYKFFEGKLFSLHPIKVEKEFDEYYGQRIYRFLGFSKLKALIEEDIDSLFLPHKYSIKPLNFLEGKEYPLKELCLYDGFYAVFQEGEKVLCSGKVEEVFDRVKKERYYRMVIGSREARGRDYVLPAFS